MLHAHGLGSKSTMKTKFQCAIKSTDPKGPKTRPRPDELGDTTSNLNSAKQTKLKNCGAQKGYRIVETNFLGLFVDYG